MKALIVVDVQNDFLPGGALAVPDGDQVIAVINRLMKDFPLVVATQDWHPRNHGSFAANHADKVVGQRINLDGLKQILWPVHCVQGSSGAAFADDLNQGPIEAIVRKGTDPSIDSYSGFFDNGHRKATGLEALLRGRGVDQVVVCGLATDYCVKFTALDARQLGFQTSLAVDACRGVNLTTGDVDRALVALQQADVQLS